MYTIRKINNKYYIYKNKECIAKLNENAVINFFVLMNTSVSKVEVNAAIEQMNSCDHNVAEFGINGLLTVTYYEFQMQAV